MVDFMLFSLLRESDGKVRGDDRAQQRSAHKCHWLYLVKKKIAFVKERLISTCTNCAVFRFDAGFLLTVSLLAGLSGSVLYRKMAQRQRKADFI